MHGIYPGYPLDEKVAISKRLFCPLKVVRVSQDEPAQNEEKINSEVSAIHDWNDRLMRQLLHVMIENDPECREKPQ